MRSTTLIFAGMLLGAACQKSKPPPPPPQPSTGEPRMVLSHEQVEKRIEERIKTIAPGTDVKQSSPSTLQLRFKDGTSAELSLETAYAVCGRRPEDCNAYVDKLVKMLQEEEEEEEPEENGE